MAHQRKLGRTAGQRKALLRGLVTNLFQNGKIVTTEAKAKEVRRTKITHNDKDQKVELQVVNDAPSKLHARRQMTAYLYNVPQQKLADENKKEYKERTKDVKYPVVEKLFREYGPMFKKRNAEKNVAGGYTRMYKLGPRRGDAAELVMLEIINIPGTDATAEAK